MVVRADGHAAGEHEHVGALQRGGDRRGRRRARCRARRPARRPAPRRGRRARRASSRWSCGARRAAAACPAPRARRPSPGRRRWAAGRSAASRGRRRRRRRARPGPRAVPAARTRSPARRSSPATRTLRPGSTASSRSTASPSTVTSSTWSTASAPAGSAAPVEIRNASPAPTAASAGAPARDSPVTFSRRPAGPGGDRVAVHRAVGEGGHVAGGGDVLGQDAVERVGDRDVLRRQRPHLGEHLGAGGVDRERGHAAIIAQSRPLDVRPGPSSDPGIHRGS